MPDVAYVFARRSRVDGVVYGIGDAVPELSGRSVKRLSAAGVISLAVLAPPPASSPTPERAQGGEFNPSGHTVAEVEAHVDEHTEQLAEVLAAEEAGKARKTLLDSLAARLAAQEPAGGAVTGEGA